MVCAQISSGSDNAAVNGLTIIARKVGDQFLNKRQLKIVLLIIVLVAHDHNTLTFHMGQSLLVFGAAMFIDGCCPVAMVCATSAQNTVHHVIK